MHIEFSAKQKRATTLRKGAAVGIAFMLALTLALEIVSADTNEQTEAPPPFQFLVTVLTDANEKGVLDDDLSALLADLFIEYLIAPHTGETLEQVKERLSVEGQSTFQFLTAVLTDANEKDTLPDSISALLSNLFIENFIAPRTGETPEQIRARLLIPRTGADDRAALVALYNATDGPDWTDNTNWLSDAPIGKWYGISTDIAGRVTGINLGGNDLSGLIPPELGNLSNLEDLTLFGNQLSGPISPELGKLSNLERLYLGGNDLNGSIPPELGNLSNLEGLYLGDNQLTGPIPPELGNLSNLTLLYLADNQLTGPIPPELGNLSNLTLLHLGYNQLSGCVPAALRDIEENDFKLLGLPFCDGAPVPTPRYSIETRDREYGYTIDIPDGWVEEGEGRYSGQESGGTLRIRSQELESETTLDQYAESVRDNLRQEWWTSASLFEITSFEKEQAGNQDFYSLRYRVRESPKYCIVDVQERIYLANSLPGNPHGFRVSIRFCDWELQSADARRLRTRLLDSFRIANQPASYYTQFITVEGITVKASDRVRSVSMYNAADVIKTMMTSLREDIQECLIRQGASLAISPLGEYITTLPEFTPQKGELDFAAGLGAVKGQPVSGVVEASLLEGYLSVTFHEFAHAVQNLCFTEDEHREWNRFYEEAQDANIFPGSYGMTNSDEFFAEFSVSYFEQPYVIQWRWAADEELTRQKLSADFPEIFSFLERTYPRFEVNPNAAPTPAFRTGYADRIVLTEHGYIVDFGTRRTSIGAADRN